MLRSQKRVARSGPAAGIRNFTAARPLPLWLAVVVSVAAGVILDLAAPAVGWWPLAFVAVSLSLLSLIGRSSWGALLVGVAFGASFYLVHIVWITRYLGVVPWFALAGLETVLIGLGSILITLGYRWLPIVFPSRAANLVGLPVLIAAIWTMRELVLGSWPYTGFPWGRIGMTQSESPLADLVSWTGVAGLTFVMVTCSAAAVEWMRAARWSDLRALAPTAGLLAILVLIPAFPTTPAGALTVGSVQGDGPAGYFDDRSKSSVFQAQITATAPLFGEEMDLLVWPEGSVDWDPLSNARVATALDRLAQRIGAPLLVNAATKRDGQTYNTSLVWLQEGGVAGLHDKTQPVPMGEYVPDREFYEKLAPDLIGLIKREYTPGTNSPLVTVAGVPVGLAICFDVLYDDVIWSSARGGAQLYIFQTNNADFRDTDENLQQLAFARMRAIETGRSVVNVSTVGTSQVIDPSGETIDQLPADTAGAMLTKVPLRTGLTPASVVGPVLADVIRWGALAALIGLGVLARRHARRDRSAVHDTGIRGGGVHSGGGEAP